MKIRKAEKREAGTGEITMEYAEQTFKELLAFQGYGFCLGYDVPVVEKIRGEIPIGSLNVGDSILTPGDEGGERWERVENVIPQGKRDAYRVGFSNGKELVITLDHPLLCSDGVLRNTSEILDIYVAKGKCDVMFRNLEKARVTMVEYIDKLPVMDITVSGKSHLFYANGCIVHNCKAHATSYSVYSAVQMWLQEHYFIEYMCALLNHIDRAKEKKGVGVLNERVEYCMRHGTTIYYPDVTRSDDQWKIVGGGMLAPLKNIKGFSDREVKTIVDNRPYADLRDFMEKTGFNKNRFEALLFSHALDCFGTIDYMYNWYLSEYGKDGKKKAKKAPKKSDTFDLFGDEEEPSSSCEPEIIVTFSKTEVEERCLDLNGFVIQDNIHRKYHEYFERGMDKIAEFRRDDSYNRQKRRICRLSELAEDIPEEDKFKNKWILAKITSEARGIPSKFGGKKFDKITISDGYDSISIFGRIPLAFKKGRVMVFPVSVSSNGKVYLDDHAMDKLEPVVLEDVD